MNYDYTAWNGATSTGQCIDTPKIDVGPYTYENPPVCFAGTNIFGDDGGSIGLDFLRHFTWSVDYPHSRFVLTPNGH